MKSLIVCRHNTTFSYFKKKLNVKCTYIFHLSITCMGQFNITFKSVIYNSVAIVLESENNSYTNCK